MKFLMRPVTSTLKGQDRRRILRGLNDGEVPGPVLPPTSPAARRASNLNRV